MSRVGGGVGQVFHFRNILSLPIGMSVRFPVRKYFRRPTNLLHPSTPLRLTP